MDVQRWAVALGDLVARIGRCFPRSESRQHAGEYLAGLLSSVERKNGWQLAEALGQSSPYALQQFLNKGPWDADEVRNETGAAPLGRRHQAAFWARSDEDRGVGKWRTAGMTPPRKRDLWLRSYSRPRWNDQ